MTVTEKIKAINNKIKQTKAQYNLDRQTTKILVLLAGNVSKYEFLTGEDIYEYNSAFFNTKYDCLIWFYCVW